MAEPFLLEIGVEELPARFCPSALDQLRARGEALLAELRLGHGPTRVYGTPRRLAWWVEDLDDRQADAVTTTRGPARQAAFDASGRPTRAAEGFARSQGVAVEDLTVSEVGGKAYVFAQRQEVGLPAAEALAPRLAGLITGLEFPRSMRWGSGDVRFPRPIRWLVALHGARVVPFTLEDLAAGRTSFGHRTLHPGPVEIESPSGYTAAMEAAGVLVDVQARSRSIATQVAAVVAPLGARARIAPELLEEITHINEWPTAFVGGFDPAALAVPEPVLVTVMRIHQRYFPVEGPDGRLRPHFVGVRNGGEAHLSQVVAGNEKVLAARFADATFFYEEDRKQTLASRVARLSSIQFAPDLGSLADKAVRLEALAAWLAGEVGAEVDVVRRAATLCKADRLTHVVYELPELEGTMGAHYAGLDGEAAAVAEAIGEHVLPRDAGDALPASAAGRVLALADRIDTLVGHFLAGRQPSGSADPLGLRRAAAAVVRILEDSGWDVSWTALQQRAADAYGRDDRGALAALGEFLAGRLRVRLEEGGHRADIVAAVLAAGADRVADAAVRCRVLGEAMGRPDWSDTITAFRRAGNLARQAGGGSGGGATTDASDVAAMEPTERALARALADLAPVVGQAEAGDTATRYRAVLAATAGLRPAVDAFLTEVLVMDPDPGVRRRRLALLASVAAVPASVADLTLLVG